MGVKKQGSDNNALFFLTEEESVIVVLTDFGLRGCFESWGSLDGEVNPKLFAVPGFQELLSKPTREEYIDFKPVPYLLKNKDSLNFRKFTYGSNLKLKKNAI